MRFPPEARKSFLVLDMFIVKRRLLQNVSSISELFYPYVLASFDIDYIKIRNELIQLQYSKLECYMAYLHLMYMPVYNYFLYK